MGFKYHHMHIVCSDLEQMKRFLTDDLGAEFIEYKKFGTADGAMLSLDGVRINLRVRRSDEKITQNSLETRYGYDHLGLLVDDVDAAYEELKAKGYKFFITPVDTAEVRMAYFRGPDELLVELLKPLSA